MKVSQPGVQNSEALKNAQAEKQAEKIKRAGIPDAAASPAKAIRDVRADAITEISPQAKELATAKAIAEAAPDVREAKIAELRRRIESKEYNVKPEDVADRIVKDHLETSVR